MASFQRTTKYRFKVSFRMLGLYLAFIILFIWCVSGLLLNTLFLTLPNDGEQALIERVSVDYCGGRQCNEIQMYNLSRMGGAVWCINLHVYSNLYDTSPLAESYMILRTGDGVWRMENIPGSICDTWSPSGRRYVLDKITGDEE